MLLLFLKMASDKEGYFVGHSSLIDRQEKFITFSYYRLFSDLQNVWDHEELFSFTLPIKYILVLMMKDYTNQYYHFT